MDDEHLIHEGERLSNASWRKITREKKNSGEETHILYLLLAILFPVEKNLNIKV